RFLDAVVTAVELRRTRKPHSLYNIGVEDDESYIAAGVVSHNCRPPGNRNPEADELAACAPFLAEQLMMIQPKVILSLGSGSTPAGSRSRAGSPSSRCPPSAAHSPRCCHRRSARAGGVTQPYGVTTPYRVATPYGVTRRYGAGDHPEQTTHASSRARPPMQN